MKAIQNVGFFNAGEYNKRYIQLQFGAQGEVQFYEGVPEKNVAYISHNFSELVRCRELDENDIKAKVEERKAKRSKSVFSKIAHGKIKQCSWNFGFILTFKQKQYELYAPTRSDRD